MPLPVRCPNDPTHRRFRHPTTGTLLDDAAPAEGAPAVEPGGLRPLFDEHLAPVCLDCGAAGILGEAE